MLKEKRERPLSTPLGTTSTDAMDTEEAQEFSKEIAEKAIERELKKQKYEQYQQVKQTSNYQVPKSITIPVPDLNKPRQEKESRLTSVLSNFDVPLYEEVLGPKEGQPIRRSVSVTPGLPGMKYNIELVSEDKIKAHLAKPRNWVPQKHETLPEIPHDTAFLCSPADVPGPRKVQLQDKDITTDIRQPYMDSV